MEIYGFEPFAPIETIYHATVNIKKEPNVFFSHVQRVAYAAVIAFAFYKLPIVGAMGLGLLSLPATVLASGSVSLWYGATALKAAFAAGSAFALMEQLAYAVGSVVIGLGAWSFYDTDGAGMAEGKMDEVSQKLSSLFGLA